MAKKTFLSPVIIVFTVTVTFMIVFVLQVMNVIGGLYDHHDKPNLALMFLEVPFMFAAVIGGGWWLIYTLFIGHVMHDYDTHVFPIKKVDVNSSKKERMLYLFFIRQQTYEVSAYILLGCCVVFLILCIMLFLFAGHLVAPDGIIRSDYEFYTSISIRVGIALVVIFITKVLLRLYRYCLRIANFHLARFDALLFGNTINMPFKDALEIFSVSADVGEEPESPFKDVVDALKGVKKPT